jgi:hypothetical protein
MSTVVPLTRPSTAEPTDRELLLRALREIAELRAEVEALKPAPRFTIPATWLNVKNAAAHCGYAEPTISEWTRKRRLTFLKIGGRLFIDPTSLPKRT